MSSDFTPVGASVSVAAGAGSVAGAITMTTPANGLHIANTSATLYVTLAFATSGAVATLGTGICVPPLGQLVIAVNPQIASVAAIGSGAGPTAVVFTPIRLD